VTYSAELEQLRLQVEVMGVLVDQNLERMRQVLETGDPTVASHALGADDDIDAMNVSLTERCYEVLARENPVASDLRLVVSVIRASSELERVGDLALRVVKAALDHDLLVGAGAQVLVRAAQGDEVAGEVQRGAGVALLLGHVDAGELAEGQPGLDARRAEAGTLLRRPVHRRSLGVATHARAVEPAHRVEDALD